MKPLHVKLNNVCAEFRKENWYHLSNCDKGIRYLENRIEIVQKLKQTFEEVTGIPNENYGRRRRGIINAGGYILSWLFGMATENEVNEYNEKIDKIQDEQLEFIHLAKDQMTVLKSTLMTINATTTQVTEAYNELSDKMSEFQNDVKEQFSTFAEQTNALLKINEIIHSIELIQNELEHTYELLIDACIHGIAGQVQPQIITIEKIKGMIEADNNYHFPKVSNMQLLKLIEPHIYVDKGKLVYVLYIPMIQGNVYKLYNVVSFPQVLKNASQVIQYLDKRPDYMITNNVHTLFASMTEVEFQKCKQLRDDLFVCKENIIISTYVPGVDCFADLLHHNTIRMPEICKNHLSYLSLQLGLWIPLKFTAGWLYVIPKTEALTIMCNTEVDNKESLQGQGRVQIREGCKGVTKAGILTPYSEKVVNMTNKLNVLPVVRIQEDCCEEVKEAEKQGILEPKIVFPHISLNKEFEYAGIRIEEIQTLYLN